MPRWSRREFPSTPTGFALAAGVACSGRPQQAAPEGERWKFINFHIHVVETRIPGVPKKAAPDGTPFEDPIPDRAESIPAQMQAAGVEHALRMPRWDNDDDDDPLGMN